MLAVGGLTKGGGVASRAAAAAHQVNPRLLLPCSLHLCSALVERPGRNAGSHFSFGGLDFMQGPGFSLALLTSVLSEHAVGHQEDGAMLYDMGTQFPGHKEESKKNFFECCCMFLPPPLFLLQGKS